MNKILGFLLLGTSATFAASATPTPTPVPFWKSKSEVYRRMTEERAAIVSAKTEKIDDQKKLTLVTAGIIHAPVKFTHEEIMDFGKYSTFVPYIEESSFDKTTQNVFVHGAVLGYHVRMTIHVKTHETKLGYQIDWESVSGGFVGMTGTIEENRTDSEHAEVSMNANYLGKTIGIPDFLLNWGLEMTAHKAINRMRTHIEEEWEKSKKH